MDNKNKVVNSIFYVMNIVIFSMLLLPSLSLSSSYWWVDNLIGLQLQWSLLAIGLLIFNLLILKKSVLMHCGLSLFLLTSHSLPLYLPIDKISEKTSEKEAEAEILSIAQLNLRYDNPNLPSLITQAQQKNFNILILQEVADNQREKINQLSDIYPYSVGVKRNSPITSGMVLFSRWPIIESVVHDLGFSGGQIIEILVQSPKEFIPLQLFSLHPPSPRDKRRWEKRNKVLNYVQQKIALSRFTHQIIVGDFNSTPWTGALQSLIGNSQLLNSSEGFGYIPSFSFLQNGALLQWISSVYIDHCLISSGIEVIDKIYHPVRGSDHVLINTSLKINHR